MIGDDYMKIIEGHLVEERRTEINKAKKVQLEKINELKKLIKTVGEGGYIEVNDFIYKVDVLYKNLFGIVTHAELQYVRDAIPNDGPPRFKVRLIVYGNVCNKILK